MSKLSEFLKAIKHPETIALEQGVNFGLSGKVCNVQVLESDGSVSFETGEFQNLILDQGLNQAATGYICDLFRVCVVGTGNSAPAVGNLGLDAEYARTNTYLPGAGNCGTTRVTTTQWAMRRTFDFASPATNQNFAELGFSSTTAVGANLFSRVLIKSGGIATPVTVLTTQSLRVVYELTVNFNDTDQVFSASFGGLWGVVSGTGRLQHTVPTTPGNPLQSVKTDGFNDAISNYGVLEPSFAGIIAVTDSAAALQTVGTGNIYAGTITTKEASLAAYTNGSFYRDKTATFGTTEANQTIRSFWLAHVVSVAHPAAWAFLMSANKTKDNLATLTLTFRISWSR